MKLFRNLIQFIIISILICGYIYNVFLDNLLLIPFLRNLIIVNINNNFILIKRSIIIDPKNYYNVMIINKIYIKILIKTNILVNSLIVSYFD